MIGNQQNKQVRYKIIKEMKNLGSETLHHIEKLLTKKGSSKQDSKKKESRSKSPLPKKKESPSPQRPTHALYQPMEKDNSIINQQVKLIYNEMEHQHNYKVQNKHSYFLNAKHPRPPLYQRAQDIVKERDLWLQQKRQQREREKQLREEQQYEQFVADSTPNKTISKYQAYQLTDRLYKDHYNYSIRRNQLKMDRLKQQAKTFRNKPQINETTKQIFKVVSEKNEYQKDVFQRFKQYSDSKHNRQKQFQRLYRDRYYPFKPTISETSKMIASKQRCHKQISRSQHCKSCIAIKREKSTSNLTKRAKHDVSVNDHLKSSPFVSTFQ